MIKNYFKIAFRQMNKQKMYSAIKIGGFALSIAACILIALYIKDELSYDHTYPDAGRIYRLVGNYNNNGALDRGVDFQPPMAKAIKADFAEVEMAGRLMPNPLFEGAGSNEIRRADAVENTHEEGFTYADQHILDILQVPMVYGDRTHALTEPFTMVISKKKADKYFPGRNPIGQLMYLNNERTKPYKITGVMKNFPATSHLQNDFLLTLTDKEFWKGEQISWQSSNYPVYLKLKPGVNAAAFQKKLTNNILQKYFVLDMEKNGVKDIVAQLAKYSIQLQPVEEIHLKSYDIHDGSSHGDIRFVWLFGAVAGFILVIACINFINLSTAKSANRAQEVGLRKVVGSTRYSLINQFLT